MKKLNRQGFLRLAGTGSAAVVATPMMPAQRWLTGAGQGHVLTFRAVVGLPARPLPIYATYVIEGHVNIATRSGAMTTAVYAGTPDALSTIALPGLSRSIRVIDVRDVAGVLHIKGVVDDRSQLRQGESATVGVHLDPSRGVASAGFFGSEVLLRLES